MGDELEEGQGQVEDTGTAPVVDESQGSETEHSLYDEYLAEIQDETHRKLLEPHAKKWDAQVTKKFQSIHDEYKPYKELGADPDTLRRAHELMQRVQNNPTEVLQALAQASGMDLNGYQQYLQQQQQAAQQPAPQQQPQQQPNPYEGYPEPLVQQFSKYDESFQRIEQVLGSLLQNNQQSQEQQAKARADYEIDQILTGLKEKYGKDLDEQYVLLQMYNGVQPDQAAQNFLNMVNSRVQQAQAPAQAAPRVMSSGGAPPAPENFDPTKASDKGVEGFVASLLQQAQSQGS